MVNQRNMRASLLTFISRVRTSLKKDQQKVLTLTHFLLTLISLVLVLISIDVPSGVNSNEGIALLGYMDGKLMTSVTR